MYLLDTKPSLFDPSRAQCQPRSLSRIGPWRFPRWSRPWWGQSLPCCSWHWCQLRCSSGWPRSPCSLWRRPCVGLSRNLVLPCRWSGCSGPVCALLLSDQCLLPGAELWIRHQFYHKSWLPWNLKAQLIFYTAVPWIERSSFFTFLVPNVDIS